MPINSFKQLSCKNPPDTQTYTSHTSLPKGIKGMGLSFPRCSILHLPILCSSLYSFSAPPSLTKWQHMELSFLIFYLSFLRCFFLVLHHVPLSGTIKNILLLLSSYLVYRHGCGIKDCGDQPVYLAVLQTVSNLGLSRSEANILKESSNLDS